MAQYSGPMPQYMAAPHMHDLQQQNAMHLAGNVQDPRRPAQQPILHVVGDVRPRLTKEQHDILEAHFQQQNKPSTNTKKGFAEQLGVPLDKINNWFQNRRAKVKQDAKKATHAMNMYQQQIAMAQLNNQPLPQPHEFFAANPHLDSSSFNNGMPQPINTNVQHLGMTQQAPQLMAPLQIVSEGHCSLPNGEMMHAFHAPEYQYDGSNMSDMADRQFSMGFDPSEDFSMFTQPFGATQVHDFANINYTGLPTSAAGYDMTMYTAAAMQPTLSDGSAPSTIGSVQSSSMTNSVGNMSVPTVSTEWSDDCDLSAQFSAVSSEAAQAAYCSPPEDSISAWSCNVQPACEQTVSPQDINIVHGPQSLPPSPPTQSIQQLTVTSECGSAISEEGISRRPSFLLEESLDDTDYDARSNSADSEFVKPSSLAARRQRPRPAALGQAALRSASFSAGMPVSPGAGSHNLNPPEQTLRRIRSGGASGITGGRIQKASGQRSPLSMSFTDGTISPKFIRQASFNSTVGSGQATLAPPTPLTPNETARFPSWQSHGSNNPSVDHGSPNGIAVSWTSDSPAVFPTRMTSSPPETPLDVEQAAQYQTNITGVPQIYRDTPPQSAPATQQAFGMAMGFPALPDGTPINSGHLAHFRRPSLQECHVAVPQPMPVFRGTITDASMVYRPVGYEQAPLAQPQITVPTQTIAAFPTPPQPAPMSIPTQHGAALSADFAVHEYNPPTTGSAKASPASATGRQAFAELPKTYHFANSGPKDYKESEA